MKESVTICVGSIGSSTFKRCLESVRFIEKYDSRVKKICIIKDKSPQSAWLNEMRYNCKDTKWCLQVDEDMYLHKNALSTLISFAKQKEADGIKILNASSLLYDLFLRRNIGSLKLWSSSALQTQEFRDVLGGDRDYARRAKKNGFKNVEISKVLGDHDSAPTCDVAYKKYFEYVNKLKKFKSDSSAINFSNYLKEKYLKEKTIICKSAYFGALDGISSNLIKGSKNNNFSEKYLYKIFSTKTPSESFSASKKIIKELIINNDINQAKSILKSLKIKKEVSLDFKDKKAYDGAKRSFQNFAINFNL